MAFQSSLEHFGQISSVFEAPVTPSAVQALIDEAPVYETRNGLRDYGLLCAASRDENGNVVVVRKDANVPSHDPTDWLVVRFDAQSGKIIHHAVFSHAVQPGNEGDTVALEISTDVAHHGPYSLTFTVDDFYQPTSESITLSHQKYYGRGTSAIPEPQIDTEYTIPLTISENAEADIIELRPRSYNVGQLAVAGC